MIIIGLVIFVIVIFYIEKVKEKKALKKVRANKAGLSKIEYINLLKAKGFNEEDIIVVYESLKDFIGDDSFLLHPDDDLHKDYVIIDLDDIELINQVHELLDLPLPDDDDFDLLNNRFKNLTATYILTLIEISRGKNTAYNNV